MDTSEFYFRVIGLITSAIIIVWLFNLWVKSVIKSITKSDAKKNWNHEGHAESSEAAIDRNTKKGVNCGGIVKLPF